MRPWLLTSIFVGVTLFLMIKMTDSLLTTERNYRFIEDVRGCGKVLRGGVVHTPNDETLLLRDPKKYKIGEEVCLP